MPFPYLSWDFFMTNTFVDPNVCKKIKITPRSLYFFLPSFWHCPCFVSNCGCKHKKMDMHHVIRMSLHRVYFLHCERVLTVCITSSPKNQRKHGKERPQEKIGNNLTWRQQKKKGLAAIITKISGS